MKISPQMTSKKLSKVETGELIRVEWIKSVPAIMATQSDTATLIFLGPIEEGKPGPVFLMPEFEANVISYGKNYELVISQDPRFMDIKNENYYNTAGAIFLTHSGKRLLSALPERGITYANRLFFDIDTAQYVDRNSFGTGSSFGKWDIHLSVEGGGSSLGQKIHSFELPAL